MIRPQILGTPADIFTDTYQGNGLSDASDWRFEAGAMLRTPSSGGDGSGLAAKRGGP